jgi:hypothetical protein
MSPGLAVLARVQTCGNLYPSEGGRKDYWRSVRRDEEQAEAIIVFLGEEHPMTLARGNIRGYEFDRMVLLFSMMDGPREIPCAVSASAMDELEHASRTAPSQREQQFQRLRDRIEQCASRKFDAGEFEGKPPGIIIRSIDFRR